MTDPTPASQPEPLEYRTPSPSERPPGHKMTPTQRQPVAATPSAQPITPADVLARLTPDQRKNPLLVHASNELQRPPFNAPDFLNPPLGIFTPVHISDDLDSPSMEHATYQNLLACLAMFFTAGPGHSGYSAAYFTQMLDTLMKIKPLSPLTDDPDEWQQHAGPPITTTLPSKEAIAKYGEYMFQNRRHSEAFSSDPSLRRYHLLSEVIPGRVIWAGRIRKPSDWLNLKLVFRIATSRVWKFVWKRSSPARRAKLTAMGYKQRTTEPHLKPATPPSPRHAASKSTNKSAKVS